MQIIHLIPNLKNGGAENVLVNLSNKIFQFDVEQCIFTFENSKEDLNYLKLNRTVSVFSLSEKKDQLYQILSNNPKAIVICWLYKTFFFYELFSKKNTLKNKYYWNIRHSDFGVFQIRQKFFLFLIGIYSNFSHCKLIYCSQKSKEVHNRFFFKTKNSIVIPNRLAKTPPNKFKSIKEKHFILFIGRNHPQKNPIFLKKIFHYVESNYNNIKLVILGKGWTKDYFKPRRDSIMIYEQKENVFDYLYQAKCLVYTSKFGEGYPNVVAEAMSVGTPIIGFDTGDYKIMTKDYKNAKTVYNETEFLNELDKKINSKSKNSDFDNKESYLKELDFNLTVKQYLNLI